MVRTKDIDKLLAVIGELTIFEPMQHAQFEHFCNIPTITDRVRYCEEILDWYELKTPLTDFREPKCSELYTHHMHAARDSLNNKSYRSFFANVNTAACYATATDSMAEVYALRVEAYCELGAYARCLENFELAGSLGGYTRRTQRRFDVVATVAERKLEEEQMGPTMPAQPTHTIYRPQMAFGPHPFVPNLDVSVQLHYSPNYGRHLRVDRPMGVGKILAIDSNFCPTITIEGRRMRCANCYRENFYSLVPCPNCTSTMFCNNRDKCREEAMATHHGVECQIVDFLLSNYDYRFVARLLVTTFRSAEDVDDFMAFARTKPSWEFNAYNVWQLPRPLPRNFRAKCVYTFVTNDEQRLETDRFKFARQAAHLLLVLRLRTAFCDDFFETDEKIVFLRDFIYRMLQASDTNGDMQKNGSTVRFTDEGQHQRIYAYTTHPLLALVNHGCKANVSFMGYGLDKKLMYTVRPLKAGDQLVVDYVQGYHREWRQKQLLVRHFYTCKCMDTPTALGYLDKDSPIIALPMQDRLPVMMKLFKEPQDTVLNHLSRVRKFLAKHDNKFPCWEIFTYRRMLDLCFDRLYGVPLEDDYGEDSMAERAAIREAHAAEMRLKEPEMREKAKAERKAKYEALKKEKEAKKNKNKGRKK